VGRTDLGTNRNVILSEAKDLRLTTLASPQLLVPAIRHRDNLDETLVALEMTAERR